VVTATAPAPTAAVMDDGTSGTTTILEAVQQAIRHTAIGQFWKPYTNCPVATMAEQLGAGLAGPNLQDTLLQLLHQTTTTPRVLPLDTRFDWRTLTLVRCRPNVEADRLTGTAQKLEHTSTRVLNDTYAMVVRLACLEHDLVVQDPSGGKRGRAGRRAKGGGGGYEVESSDEDDGDAHMVDAVQFGDGVNPEDLY